MRTFWVDEASREHMSLTDAGTRPQASWQELRALREEARARRRLGSGLEGPGYARAGARRCRTSPPATTLATRVGRPEDDGSLLAVRADDDRRGRRPGGVDQDACSRARASSRDRTPGATCRSASASTRWARSSTACGARRDRQAVRLDLPDVLRLHARQRATVGADGASGVWVWTHDSIGARRGRTDHQPVEHYASLRAIPKLWVIAPADANETSHAWRVALERDDGPVALLLSRQGVPRARPRREGLGQATSSSDGGYVAAGFGAARARAEHAPELILISTGAEVADHARGRRKRSPARGWRCGWCRCPAWSCSKRSRRSTAKVLPREVGARLAVEPGARLSWWRWVGDRGTCSGLDRFGATAPGRTAWRSSASRREHRRSCAGAARKHRQLRRTRGGQMSTRKAMQRASGSVRAMDRLVSRDSIRGGHMQELIDDYAVVGATSNPTIFQTAMAAGGAYDEQMRELARAPRACRRRSGRWPSVTSVTPATCSAGVEPRGRDGDVSLEVDPDARVRDARPPIARRCACTRSWTGRTCW